MKDILEIKDGVISIRKDMANLPEFEAVDSADRTLGKVFVAKVLSYTYYVHSLESPFRDYFSEERKVEWARLTKYKVDDVEGNRRAMAFVDKYRDMSIGFIKRSAMKVRIDIEHLHKRLGDIPFEIPVKIEVEVEIPESRDSKQMVRYPVKRVVMMDNTKQKKEAISMFEQLYELYERLDRKARESGEDEFDDGEYNTITESK